MSQSVSVRLTLALAVLAGPASPALAKTRPIKVTAAALADDSTRMCMPKTVLATPTKDQPNTICQSISDWKAQGVVFQPF